MEKRLVNPDNLCMGCMAELAQPYARCPRCGLETRNYRRPQNSLPLYEIVNGKYMNGRVIGMLDMEGAEIAAITHGHSLGYMPAAVVTHIIYRIVFGWKEQPLKDIVMEAKKTVQKIFRGDKHLKELTDIIDLAVRLSENHKPDLDNINRIGEGWVAEETLGIALYCALRHQNDFSAGVTAAVNHKGDSDSTGAVTGNILGALLGFGAIEEKWKTNLELIDVIIEMADDLCHGC